MFSIYNFLSVEQKLVSENYRDEQIEPSIPICTDYLVKGNHNEDVRSAFVKYYLF